MADRDFDEMDWATGIEGQSSSPKVAEEGTAIPTFSAYMKFLM
jgi:hypothetical protein